MNKILLIILLLICSKGYSQFDVVNLKTGQSLGLKILQVSDSALLVIINDSKLSMQLHDIINYKLGYKWYDSHNKEIPAPQVAIVPSKNGYSVDSLIRYVKVVDELLYMRKQFRSYNDYYYGSFVLLVAGTGMSTIGILQKNELAQYVGLGVTTIGVIMQLYCHHFIGKAGIGIGGKGVVVHYTF